MKLRNQLLALACLLGFGALGWLYVRTWVVQKPFGIILFISDGMVARHITMARLYEGGADHRLPFESFPHTALLRNSARDFAVPDDAAAATALATGVRVNHRVLSLDGKGQPLRTIADLARAQNRSIGIVSNGPLAAATSAAFFARAADARDTEGVALQLLGTSRPEVILGGGANAFLPAGRGGVRKDGRDLIAELRGKGCDIVTSKAELENAARFRTGGIAGFFAPGPLAFSNQIESGSQQPSLSDMVRRAIQFLQEDPDGYLLIVDAALVGTAAEGNQGERAITETVALGEAINTAVKYAGDKSLVLAVGKHATGGLALNGYPLRQDHGVALLGNNPAGYPYLTWATGPNGPAPASPALLPQPDGAPATRPRSEPAAFQTSSALNNAEDVLAIGQGAGAEKLRGFLDNTAIFDVIREAL
jgi:alkaline phosphatase